jgi:hypothetical protein
MTSLSSSIGRLASVLGLPSEATGEFSGVANVVPVGPESDKAGFEQIARRVDGRLIWLLSLKEQQHFIPALYGYLMQCV